ncbi:MAG: GNAT family N-acetyltransferase [Candidatus Bathyarchaeota archaeon]|nr:GNAT family N-acetyltransferase [Candidatus Bathyarchaeota archaeon]
MHKTIVIEPMTEGFILWRCLHGGPLSKNTINVLPKNKGDEWEAHRVTNIPLLKKIIKTYGTCAILARDGDQIVGFLRFYPKILYSMKEAGTLCLQQAFPTGPSKRLVDKNFPSLDDIHDRTLKVHCLMTGSPFQEENPYQRKGIGTRMARELMHWAKEKGWGRIETTANEDLGILYANTGQAGRRFWEKLGFQVVKTGAESRFQGDFLKKLHKQAVAHNLNPEDVHNQYTMHIDL